jgi:hypothetical protein
MPSRIAAFVSRVLVYIISMVAGFHYVTDLLRQPVERFASIGISAFAILAGLAAVCYSMIPTLHPDKDRGQPQYAGEKFLHSSILILQTLFLKYAEGGVFNFIKSASWLQSLEFLVNPIFYSLYFATGIYAFYFFVFGFDELNSFLWDCTLQRMGKKEAENRQEKLCKKKGVPHKE